MRGTRSYAVGHIVAFQAPYATRRMRSSPEWPMSVVPAAANVEPRLSRFTVPSGVSMLDRRQILTALPIAAALPLVAHAQTGPVDDVVMNSASQKAITPDQALAELKAGNERTASVGARRPGLFCLACAYSFRARTWKLMSA